MGFISSMFNGALGAGFQPGANQNSGIGQASATQAKQLSGVDSGLQNIAQNGSALAQSQLQQATNQNIAQNAGMISSQKGLNPALAARQASENAAQTGQTAANQSAALQAQTQMGAMGQLSGNLLGQQQVYQGALANQNTSQAGVAAANAQGQQAMLGGAMNGLGMAAMAAQGGMVPRYDVGGMVNNPPMLPASNGPQSMAGQAVAMNMANPPPPTNPFNNPTPSSVQDRSPRGQGTPSSQSGGASLQQGSSNLISALLQGGGNGMAKGGRVPALVSPGEKYLSPEEVKKVAKGEKPAIKAGEKIPGKPKVRGNSYQNDTVPKTLESGGIVIPNSVMQSRDPAKEASKFVAAILAKQRS